MLTSSPKIRLIGEHAHTKISRARGALLNAALIQELLGIPSYSHRVRSADGSVMSVRAQEDGVHTIQIITPKFVQKGGDVERLCFYIDGYVHSSPPDGNPKRIKAYIAKVSADGKVRGHAPGKRGANPNDAGDEWRVIAVYVSPDHDAFIPPPVPTWIARIAYAKNNGNAWAAVDSVEDGTISPSWLNSTATTVYPIREIRPSIELRGDNGAYIAHYSSVYACKQAAVDTGDLSEIISQHPDKTVACEWSFAGRTIIAMRGASSVTIVSGERVLIELDDIAIRGDVSFVSDLRRGAIVPTPDGVSVLVHVGIGDVLRRQDGNHYPIDQTYYYAPAFFEVGKILRVDFSLDSSGNIVASAPYETHQPSSFTDTFDWSSEFRLDESAESTSCPHAPPEQNLSSRYEGGTWRTTPGREALSPHMTLNNGVVSVSDVGMKYSGMRCEYFVSRNEYKEIEDDGNYLCLHIKEENALSSLTEDAWVITGFGTNKTKKVTVASATGTASYYDWDNGYLPPLSPAYGEFVDISVDRVSQGISLTNDRFVISYVDKDDNEQQTPDIGERIGYSYDETGFVCWAYQITHAPLRHTTHTEYQRDIPVDLSECIARQYRADAFLGVEYITKTSGLGLQFGTMAGVEHWRETYHQHIVCATGKTILTGHAFGNTTLGESLDVIDEGGVTRVEIPFTNGTFTDSGRPSPPDAGAICALFCRNTMERPFGFKDMSRSVYHPLRTQYDLGHVGYRYDGGEAVAIYSSIPVGLTSYVYCPGNIASNCVKTLSLAFDYTSADVWITDTHIDEIVSVKELLSSHIPASYSNLFVRVGATPWHRTVKVVPIPDELKNKDFSLIPKA